MEHSIHAPKRHLKWVYIRWGNGLFKYSVDGYFLNLNLA